MTVYRMQLRMSDGFKWDHGALSVEGAVGIAKEYAARHGAVLEAGDAMLLGPTRLVFLSGKEDGNRIVGYANIDEDDLSGNIPTG